MDGRIAQRPDGMLGGTGVRWIKVKQKNYRKEARGVTAPNLE
jgi:hypothetical protein